MPDLNEGQSSDISVDEVQCRLDVRLVQLGLVKSRTEARELVLAGMVEVEGKPAVKPAQIVSPVSEIRVLAQQRRFVSRGGDKLDAALEQFQLALKGKRCLDVGASTGGFTDCLLQRGAHHVTAIDVGHGQLVSSIADNPRVESREGVNARNISPQDFGHSFDIIVVDLSFISLKLILPALFPLLGEQGDVICLVKPQFEVGRQALGRGGIVRSAQARSQAVTDVQNTAKEIGFRTMGLIESPIAGGDGNLEYLLWLRERVRP